MGWRAKTFGSIGVVLALMGGYLVLDAFDVVPGLLTLAPPPPQPAPFPTAPGAVPAPQPTQAFPYLPSTAAIPAATTVEALVEAVVANENLGTHTGAIVLDGLTGQILGAANEHTGITPASTQKLLTGVAALSELDPFSRLETTAVLASNDLLVLVGGGDMLLSAGAGDPTAVNGHAGLADLAAQVAPQITLTGRTSIRLGVDDTKFEGPLVAPAVPEGEFEPGGFIGPIVPIAVNVALRSAEYASSGPRYFQDAPLAAGRAFAQALAEHGVEVTGPITRVTAPANARPLGAVHSATIVQITEFAMQLSENTITEVLGRLVAIEMGVPPTWDGAIAAVTRAVERVGIDMSESTLVDLSGLGRGSLLTPTLVADTVRLTIDPAHPHLRELAVGMPIANLTGTLLDRFGGVNPGRGWVRAKTGTLPGVSGLAGTVITHEDRLLVFAVLADGVPDGGAWGAREAIDAFAGRLAELGTQQ